MIVGSQESDRHWLIVIKYKRNRGDARFLAFAGTAVAKDTDALIDRSVLVTVSDQDAESVIAVDDAIVAADMDSDTTNDDVDADAHAGVVMVVFHTVTLEYAFSVVKSTRFFASVPAPCTAATGFEAGAVRVGLCLLVSISIGIEHATKKKKG
ncbi:hypothetical protein FISHEDRAFT_73279 [Fistulina hepatica ATCC 64428]|uniref:Uncharacterized protein n=1 Tax=Fistulina hepatica ATCC 64428 TaxID=1128425 RepID=A0A0D7ACY2_9AGAR|nr:hypothetical protein FISHEDRAFT_73279 [Fistulina hepatica ATCC 64428]